MADGVVAAVLRAIGQHGAVRSDRRCHEQAVDSAGGSFGGEALDRRAGELGRADEQRGSGGLVVAGGEEPGGARLVRGGHQHTRTSTQVGEVGVDDRLRIGGYQPCRPQRVIELASGLLQRRRESAVDHDRYPVPAHRSILAGGGAHPGSHAVRCGQ